MTSPVVPFPNCAGSALVTVIVPTLAPLPAEAAIFALRDPFMRAAMHEGVFAFAMVASSASATLAELKIDTVSWISREPLLFS